MMRRESALQSPEKGTVKSGKVQEIAELLALAIEKLMRDFQLASRSPDEVAA
jgi:hypothetical protein